MDKVDKFIKDPKKSLFKLAWPVMIAMLVQSLYNVVDTAFIGRLGTEAIAALTFAFPIFFLLMAINQGVGVGTTSLIARRFGAKQYDAAENSAWHGLFLSIVFAFIIFLAWPFLKPIFALMGASSSVLELSVSYMSIIIAGVFFLFPASIFTNIFMGQGDMKTAMKIQIGSLLINIILDPIFIYTLGMGVKGAAIATVISFLFSLLLSIYLIRTKSKIKMSWDFFEFHWRKVKDILIVGFPATLMMLLMSVYIAFINKFMAHYGVNYVAAFGLTSRIHSIALIPIIAFSVSVMTLVGMFYGANRHDLVRKVIFYALKLTLIFTTLIGIFFFAFPKFIFVIFTSNQTLLNLASAYLRVEVFAFPFMSIGMTISRSLQGMGLGLPSLVITIVRILFVAIPLSYFFVFVLGYSYLWVAVSSIISGMAASIIAFIWLFTKLE